MARKNAASPAKSEKPISEAAARIIEKDIEFLMQVILSLPKSEVDDKIKWDNVANNLGCTRNAASKRWVRILKRWEPATSLEATHEEDEKEKEGE
ncbi:hypothetical protein N7490_001282 [Penicillium lividum]|nr:hypothetical protein N7490_001282 [Penicillium lividum]